MSLSTEQIDALLAPLDPGRVRSLRGNSHLEAWDDRRHLLRVFGWGGWDVETLECTCVSERSVWEENNPLKGRHSVVYRVQARLIVKDLDGVEVAHFDDGATGDSQNQPSLGDAHDQALKTAMSQALKRCAVNLGDRFGLSLYDNGKAAATVGRTLGNASTQQHEASEAVQSGELDEQQPDVAAHNASQEQAVPAEDAEAEAQAWFEGFRDYLLAGPQETGRKAAAQFYAKAIAAGARRQVLGKEITDASGTTMTVRDLIEQEQLRLGSAA